VLLLQVFFYETRNSISGLDKKKVMIMLKESIQGFIVEGGIRVKMQRTLGLRILSFAIFWIPVSLANAQTARVVSGEAEISPKAYASEPNNPHVLHPKTKSVAIFKDEMGFFSREAQAELNDGWC